MTGLPPPTPQPLSAWPLPPAEFERWYGGWDPISLADVARFMAGFDSPWWVVGGWALEKFTPLDRAHDDLDISVASHDADHLRRFLRDRGWTTWNMDSGWLRPYDERFREIRPSSSIWVRADAGSPWVLDVPLTPFRDGQWTNKKLPDQAMSLDDATWVSDDGLRYLNPEIVLFMKAAQARDKDTADAEAVLPLLDDRRRAWLRSSIASTAPHHPWASLG
ncbi:nucleotidyltransferase domain-containing protein [Beutenbergia cavernae]|uniref:nucleotidyltransferase domain-containing protein n=1 Tax=Beutenbergia cavernae TaxID=84757 RepID=UPI001FE142C3|nr:hypothetical protein [Beutenbergia cavernae]